MKAATAFLFLFASLLAAATATAPHAQETTVIPNFWDPNERFVKPELGALPRLRFLTTTDFPPFNFIDRRKRLTGFHVDLARALCERLEIIPKCQIQALPWSDLDFALVNGDGEALIAGVAITEETRKKYDFTHPYLKTPGRFIQRNGAGLAEPLYEGLAQLTTGVVSGSGHETYFQKYFAGRNFRAFPTRQLAFNALIAGEIDVVFTDGVSASFWLASANSGNCCSFAGGPYVSDEYFGSGFAIAVEKGDTRLATALNFALKAVNDDGTFRELYLRYFPYGLY